jgi:hypothetical protein
LITGDQPTSYWFVLPVTIVVGLIGLLFAWALVRSIRQAVADRRVALT